MLDEHELALLLEACRTVDALGELSAIVEREGAMLGGRANPALVEARAQRLVFARVLASLRLSNDLANLAEIQRPQRRGAARGTYLRKVV